jgi:RND superfamily putative drug exporter
MISGVSSFVQIGFAVSIGIVMSAFLLGLTMVPALTASLGDHVWWPSRHVASTARRAAGAARPAAQPAEAMSS